MLHPRYRTPAITYAIVAAMLLLVTVILPVAGVFEVPRLPTDTGVTHEGEVVAIVDEQEEETPSGVIVRQQLLVQVDGQQVTVERAFVEGAVGDFELQAGDSVLVGELQTPDGPRYVIRDQARRVPLWALSLAFAAMVVLVGGRQGVLSLIGLVMSFLVIIRYIVPGILSGGDPLLFAISGAVVIMTSTLLISHGVNPKTWIAIGGTTASLLITGVLAWVSVRFAQLTGMATEDDAVLQMLTAGVIEPRGLLLAGIIIGALGVLDDVTTTQSSTVVELRRANPALGVAQLMRRGMNVGRDHIAATTNTLVLAYSGAALPLLMILVAQPEPFGILISFDSLATEIVRTLVGSIGIVAAVPVTTALAAVVVGSGFVHIEPEPDERTALQVRSGSGPGGR